MKYLVTGGLGFIGSHFIEEILKDKETISVINIDKCTYAANKDFDPNDLRYTLVREDVGLIPLIETHIKPDAYFDVVVNFASHSHVDNSLEGPLTFYHNNVLGCYQFLDLCRRWQQEGKVGKVVHISTDEVYGDLKDSNEKAFNESSALKPSSPYSASKAAQEMIVHSLRKMHGFRANILRLSNNFGPRQHSEKFLPTVISNALRNKSIRVYGDGSQEREWMYVEDCVKYIKQVCLIKDDFEDYCVSDGTSADNLFMIHAIYNLMRHAFKLPAVPSIKHVEDRLGHDRAYKLDCTKFKNHISFELAEPTDINQRLQKTIDYYFYIYKKSVESEEPCAHLTAS